MKTVLQIALGIILAVVVLGGIGYGVYVANQPSWEEKERAESQRALAQLKADHKRTCEKLQELGATKKAQECFAELGKD